MEEFSVNNVTVTVEWTQQVGAVYNTTVSPPVLVPVIFNGGSNLQLLLEYNTEYSLSVIVVTPCGNVTTFTTLNYG